MKTLKALFIKALIWLLKKSFASKLGSEIEPTIINLYKQTARDDVKLKCEIVQVKKGSRRYLVAYFEGKNQIQRANIGRHKIDNGVTVGLN